MATTRFRHLRRLLLVGAVVSMFAALGTPGVAAQDGSTASSQGSDSTGRQLTDFTAELAVPGFDSSLGDLAAAELTIAGAYDGQVVQITNQSGGTADFVVSTDVRLCAEPIAAGATTTYVACSAAPDSTTIMFETGIVQESFTALPAGASESSAAPGTATDTASVTVLDPAALAEFVDAVQVPFGVTTVAGFSALGGGGNSTVQVETFADVTLSVQYLWVALDVAKLTNGVDGAVVSPGDAVTWTYDVTNNGNTAVVDIAVVDDLEGDICTIALLAPGETHQCSLTGVAGDAPYTNVATATGTPGINPAVTTSADDPSNYLQPVPTPMPDPSPTPVPSAPTSPPLPGPDPDPADPEPVVDIELSTNGEDADDPTGPSLEVGDPVTWRYVVTNTGPVDLRDLIVADDVDGGVCIADHLAVGDSFACTGSGTASLGQAVRVATVNAESYEGQPATDRDPTHHIVGDEVEGIVVTPTVVPVSNPIPDEVLARTGESGNGAAAIALIVSGLGLVLLSGSEALRRRYTSVHD